MRGCRGVGRGTVVRAGRVQSGATRLLWMGQTSPGRADQVPSSPVQRLVGDCSEHGRDVNMEGGRSSESGERKRGCNWLWGGECEPGRKR